MPAKTKIISFGEILWDVFPDGERLGGAAFNFAVHSTRLGEEVTFVSAVGDDERGRKAMREADRLGLPTRSIRVLPGKETGRVTVTLNDGQPSYVIHRPAAYEFPELTNTEIKLWIKHPMDWIYFGTLQNMGEQARGLLIRLIRQNCALKRFYDVNLRRDSYTPALVRELFSLAHVVKLNAGEAVELQRMFEWDVDGQEGFCRRAASQFQLEAICVTRGAEGCALWMNGEFLDAPGRPVEVADAVGAGDAFSAALLHGIASGSRHLQRIANFANRVGALVASRPGAVPAWSLEEVL